MALRGTGCKPERTPTTSSRAVGSLSSAYFSGAALQALGAKTVFGISSILPLLVTAAAVFVDEPRLEEAPDEADADEASSQIEVAKAQVAQLAAVMASRTQGSPCRTGRLHT